VPVDDGISSRVPVVLGPGEGREYPMGRIAAVFKADGGETGRGYAISEWWLDPYTAGPGFHSHPEDDMFYVLAGTMSILVDTQWIDAARLRGKYADQCEVVRRTSSRRHA
jgi:mannose-6-phosphate isomerase-like protein (cupin superfamily)